MAKRHGVARAAMLVAVAGVLGSGALAQSLGSASPSSSPFAKLFGGKSNEDSPVDLEIRVDGADDGLSGLIRNSSLIASALDENRYTGQDVLAAARGDYARILGTLYARGYYSAVINILLDGREAAGIAPLDAPATVRKVLVTVQTGPVFKFSQAAIGPLAPGTKLPSDYREGRTAGTDTIKDAAAAGVSAWREASHAKARVADKQIIADHNANTVASQILLAPGPRVTFGRLQMSGYDRMDPRRLAKIAGFPTGEAYDPEKLETVRKRLRRAGVFSAITLTEAEALGPGNTLDVDLAVVEQKPRRIGGGFEISNDNGAQLSAFWMHRNLLGGGERLRIDGAVSDIGSRHSGRDYALDLRIERPATITADTTAFVETGVARMREPDYDFDVAYMGLGFTRIYSDRLTANLGLRYQVGRYRDETGKYTFRLLSLPVSATWDKRDNMTDAKRGHWLSGEVVPFYGFGETGSGAQIKAEARGYFTPTSFDKLTLAGRVRLGSVVGPDLRETPRDFLFYSGGGGTVRGQAFQALGVEVLTNEDGDLVKTGGMSLATISGEMRYQLREKIGLVGFVDAGQVWTGGAFGGDSDWHAGAGVGVRYSTPIGPIRFDLGVPLHGGEKNKVQLYLGLGQAF